MSGDREIDEVLTEEGFGGTEALHTARATLEAAGLTHAGKRRISEDKLPRLRDLLSTALARVCADPGCRAALERLKPSALQVRVAPTACERCGGSDNRKAMRRLAERCAARGVGRVVILGGSPSVREELLALKPPQLELRLVDGTERRTSDKARADLEWAQLVLVWGGSELDHRVSQLYTGHPAHRRKLVLVARRGIAALLNAGADHLERSREP